MDHATTLSLGRIGIGAAAWAAPEFSLKAMMLDGSAPQSAYLARLFGARDVALGVLTLMAAPERKPALLVLGVAVDSADAAAGALIAKSGGVSKKTGAALTAVAVFAAGAGVLALGQHRALRNP